MRLRESGAMGNGSSRPRTMLDVCLNNVREGDGVRVLSEVPHGCTLASSAPPTVCICEVSNGWKERREKNVDLRAGKDADRMSCGLMSIFEFYEIKEKPRTRTNLHYVNLP